MTLRWLLLLFLLMTACSEQTFQIQPNTKAFAGSVEINNKVDILWVLDNSSSMKKHQDLLSQQVDFFMSDIMKGNYDFHVGVIHTDMNFDRGPGVLLGSPSILTPSVSGVRGLLQDRFRVGEDGTSMEQGLAAMKKALSPENLGGVNRGFLRQDASLVIIFLSDEQDHSPDSVADYKAFLDELKPTFAEGTRGWSAHFIGVLRESGTCRAMNDFSSVGSRYMELVNESSGVNESICGADFSQSLAKIQQRIVSVLTDFPLDRRPAIETLRVWLGGEEVPQDNDNGWVYLAERNVISFRGSFIPSDQAKIRVDFTPESVFD